MTPVALVAAAALAACAPSGGPNNKGSGDPSGGPTGVATDIGDEPVTLKLMSTPESGESTLKAIEAFKSVKPNNTNEYDQTNYEDYNNSLNLALASDTAPDIVLLNAVGVTVKNGLVKDLSQYAQAYGWEDAVPANQLAQWRVAADGATLGEGPLYASPAGFSLVGVYYNKALARQVGIDPLPTTIDEFKAALSKARDAGVLPLQLGNGEGHASFPVQLIGQAVDGPASHVPWVYGHAGATFDTPGNRQGLDMLAEWARDGYLPDGANGADLQGAVNNFIQGKGLFFVDGAWDAAKIADGLGDDAGFFAFPGATGIGTSVAYGISSASKNPDAAAAFLDFMQTAAAGRFQYEQGFMPVDASAITETTGVKADLLRAWNQVGEADGLVGFNNNATATMNDTLMRTTQEIIGGRLDTDGAIAQIQADWQETHGA
jgi:ABC-type glycerol-3-phosphate transport system substrate-binding protein